MHNQGFYYHLIAFENDSNKYSKNKVIHASLTFSNQKDSVFWDSENNFNNLFYIYLAKVNEVNQLSKALSCFTKGDSVCVLIPVNKFYKQQFNYEKTPFFSVKDSVVKVNFKILDIIPENEYFGLRQNSEENELNKIKSYFSEPEDFTSSLDSSGFYWIEKPETIRYLLKNGDTIRISYRGWYLNGRFLENSEENLEYIVGTPDQILKGLKIVIGKLNLGDSCKIILPSRLAFGEFGSSNGMVPPNSPLVYKLKITK